jgi:hypothetical protein
VGVDCTYPTAAREARQRLDAAERRLADAAAILAVASRRLDVAEFS